ncbi:Hypothetical protein ERGA_CDS_03970 [Ehrlichia ruminantium str. Gardel]|uniref:hypothetical protein n=1 Tax=Ehrlichia ruminantium TaxID=779 RepID=UPI00004C77D3|nr:hypothetical protein [Ehrlichia ruminantium]CAI27849.1 Hypothetical protein ERGA_CDS_03970 [Ehrlichia ruminantium str. Gardel]
MLLSSKLKIKTIYSSINRSYDLKKLRHIHIELRKLKKNLYKSKKISKNTNRKAYVVHKKYPTVNKLKKDIKLEIKTLLMSTIAHEMDPIQRAGQTITSNIRGAKKFGRGAQAKKKSNYKSQKKNVF